MDKLEITKLIEEALRFNSETASVEFKDARGGFPKDIWKTISSFSHQPGGGVIAFGFIDDKQTKRIITVGVDNIAFLQESMGNLISNEMSFTVRPEYHILEINNKSILAIFIPECPDQFKPCYFKAVGMNAAYIRDGNADRKITDEEMRKFVENSKKLKFDANRAEGVGLNDISKEKILDLLIKSGERSKRESSLDEINFELMKNLGIVNDYDGKTVPTIAGFLIFSKDKPQKKQNFSRYLIRCVKYKGSNVATNIIDSVDVGGTLDEQIDSVQKFILRNIHQSASIIGTKRVEKYEYPEDAIREIVANAIIHRDYKITETYTQVNIFEDRIEIFNPGCLPPGVTIENIKDAQVSRNETIAARLKEFDYLEEYGRGIDIVFSKMKEWSLLPPIFKNTANSFKVILMGKSLSKLNERQITIWQHLVENQKISASECQQNFPRTSRKTLNLDLKKMQNMGLIHQVGESKSIFYIANF